ncbi:MAG TPA: rhamnogalacturonan acetylesterase [Verrucomicrobiae bacterium]|nr:rhamnogalacturonan acetylesterase [Verrucomicrobiae bacterium]
MLKRVPVAALAIVLLALCACRTAQNPRLHTAHGPTIFMIGDSTMANKPLTPAQPERGWGQLLPLYFKPEVRVENLAMNGRSSRSFRSEGRWDPVMQQLKPGDYVIIQFGHNDQKADAARHTDPMGTFKENLSRYVNETRSKGGRPILATPIIRRAFTNDTELMDTHGDYSAAARQAAAEQKVPLLDLQRRTEILVEALGPELSKRLFMWVEAGEYAAIPEGKKDNTHLNPLGASRICDLAVEEIRAVAPELAAWLREKP